jgi:hypothetical protein
MSYREVPCGAYDTIGAEKDTIVLYGWAVKGQLDAEKLIKAWWKLARAWPILTAQLKDDMVKSKIEKQPCWYI